MKYFLLFFTGFFLSSAIMAQSPEGFNYQAVARDNAGSLLISQAVGVRVSIHDSTPAGTIVYQETHAVTTNAYGLFSLEIGSGIVSSGVFANIGWGAGAKYIQVEADPTGGSNYTDLGTTQLLSVPYALYAADGNQGPQGIQGVQGPQGTPGNPGPPGTTGQAIHEVYGTGQLQVTTATTTYTLIPGLTQTIAIPANAIVHIHTDGGIQSTGATSSTYSVVDVAIFVDGVVSTSAGQRRISIANTTALAQLIGNWSMDKTVTLSPGNHTFEVKAVNGAPGASTANVSSASAPQLQGVLTVTILKL